MKLTTRTARAAAAATTSELATASLTASPRKTAPAAWYASPRRFAEAAPLTAPEPGSAAWLAEQRSAREARERAELRAYAGGGSQADAAEAARQA